MFAQHTLQSCWGPFPALLEHLPAGMNQKIRTIPEQKANCIPQEHHCRVVTRVLINYLLAEGESLLEGLRCLAPRPPRAGCSSQAGSGGKYFVNGFKNALSSDSSHFVLFYIHFILRSLSVTWIHIKLLQPLEGAVKLLLILCTLQGDRCYLARIFFIIIILVLCACGCKAVATSALTYKLFM